MKLLSSLAETITIPEPGPCNVNKPPAAARFCVSGWVELMFRPMILPGSYVTDDAGLKVSVTVGGGAGVMVRVLVAVPLG